MRLLIMLPVEAAATRLRLDKLLLVALRLEQVTGPMEEAAAPVAEAEMAEAFKQPGLAVRMVATGPEVLLEPGKAQLPVNLRRQQANYTQAAVVAGKMARRRTWAAKAAVATAATTW